MNEPHHTFYHGGMIFVATCSSARLQKKSLLLFKSNRKSFILNTLIQFPVFVPIYNPLLGCSSDLCSDCSLQTVVVPCVILELSHHNMGILFV